MSTNMWRSRDPRKEAQPAMAKKQKTAEEIEREREEIRKRNMVMNDHAKLVKAVSDLKEMRDQVQQAIVSPAIAAILAKFEKHIEEAKEQLVSCEKKDVDATQASVKARRSLLAMLRGAYQEDLDAAQVQLANFERQNALFLQAGQSAQAESEENEPVAEEA